MSFARKEQQKGAAGWSPDSKILLERWSVGVKAGAEDMLCCSSDAKSSIKTDMAEPPAVSSVRVMIYKEP